MAHVYHADLPGYDPAAVFHDGCPTCEERARGGLLGLMLLDRDSFARLWAAMLGREHDVGRERPRSGLDAIAATTLYRVGVLLERHGVPDVWDRVG